MSETNTDDSTDWPGILICAVCKQYVDADRDDELTACEHTWDEARDISDCEGEEWAKIRHDAYVRELERDEPRNRQVVLAELSSLMWDLISADVLPADYDEREGLEKLLTVDGDAA